jgi:hypothetical protein
LAKTVDPPTTAFRVGLQNQDEEVFAVRKSNESDATVWVLGEGLFERSRHSRGHRSPRNPCERDGIECLGAQTNDDAIVIDRGDSTDDLRQTSPQAFERFESPGKSAGKSGSTNAARKTAH